MIYAPDLLALVRYEFDDRPIVPPPISGNSFSSLIEDGSAEVWPWHVREPVETEREVVEVSHQTFLLSFLGDSLSPLSSYFLLSESVKLGPSEKHALDDALARSCWEGCLMVPQPLRHAILQAAADRPSSQRLFGTVLDRAHKVFLHPDLDVEQAKYAWMRQRLRAAERHSENRLSARQAAVAELVFDCLLIQWGARQDLLRVEKERAADELRVDALMRVDDANDLQFEALLPYVVNTGVMAKFVSKERGELLRPFENQRAELVGRLVPGAIPPPVSHTRVTLAMTTQLEGAMDSSSAKQYLPPPRRTSAKPAKPRNRADIYFCPELDSVGLGTIGVDMAYRHFLLTGSTGSGKTTLLRALARSYVRGPIGDRGRSVGPAPAMLVVDPKHELFDLLSVDCRALGREADLRRFHSEDEQVVDFFEGIDPMEDDVTPESLMTRILVLFPNIERERLSRSPFFVEQARVVLKELLDVSLLLYRFGGELRLKDFWDRIADELPARLKDFTLRYQCDNLVCTFSDFVGLVGLDQKVVTAAFGKACAEHGIPRATWRTIGSWETLAWETCTSVVATWANTLSLASSAAFARKVNLNPFHISDEHRRLSVITALNDGSVVCVLPSHDDGEEVGSAVARTLKEVFYRLSLSDARDQERPFVIIMDEAHRVITDQEFRYTDRARAYGCTVLAATQTISALVEAVVSRNSTDAALEAILQNFGTQIFMKATDPLLESRLRLVLSPSPISGAPHVLHVRPLSALAVGEFYFCLASGRSGRRCVDLSQENVARIQRRSEVRAA